MLFPACNAFHFVLYSHIKSLKDVCTVDAVQTWTGYILSFTCSNPANNFKLKHNSNT